MFNQKLLVLVGAALGLVPIALGIAALVTKEWLKLGTTISSLLICDGSATCPSGSTYDTAKGLEIAGVCVIGIGVITAIIIGLLVNNRHLKLIPVALIYIGSVLVLIGLLLYAKAAFKKTVDGIYQQGLGQPSGPPVEIGYSLILMVITCIIGFLLSTYFAYAAGLRQSADHTVTQERVFVREAVLF